MFNEISFLFFKMAVKIHKKHQPYFWQREFIIWFHAKLQRQRKAAKNFATLRDLAPLREMRFNHLIIVILFNYNICKTV